MANAVESQGFLFQIAPVGTSPLGYTTVGEITSWSSYDGQAAEIDVTHLQSTAKEWLMGLQDFGNFTLEANYLYNDPGQDLMRTAKASRDLYAFRATTSDGEVATFQGYVLSATQSGSVDGKVDTSFNVRISGNVTFA